MVAMNRESTRERHAAEVRKILAYIRDHADGDLSLENLAARAFSSPFHFHRVFKELTGRTPKDHVQSLRRLQAALALRHTDLPVVRIALDSGFQTHEAFTRSFRSFFGATPTTYRTRARRNHKGAASMKNLSVKIGLVKIPVTQFAQACAFYRDVLGLEEEFAVEAYGWAQYKTGNVPLCPYVAGKGGGDGTPGGETGIHLNASDAAHAHEFLKKRDARVGDLVKSDDGGVFFMVKDPDGNAIKVCQFG
jgi:AraC-like DNA-binding protein/catechol 2,3-dioxygenase-like lactoylglutathione lyase family enzyme